MPLFGADPPPSAEVVLLNQVLGKLDTVLENQDVMINKLNDIDYKLLLQEYNQDKIDEVRSSMT